MNCDGCYYWKPVDRAVTGMKRCHYLLINGHRRPRDGNGDCLGFEERKDAQKRVNKWIFWKGENA